MPATRHENKRVARLEIARVAFGANPALVYCYSDLLSREMLCRYSKMLNRYSNLVKSL